MSSEHFIYLVRATCSGVLRPGRLLSFHCR